MTDTAELTYLDESILADECKCECPHKITTCSYEVTHLHTACTFSDLVCWNATQYVLKTPEWDLRSQGVNCSACGRLSEDCWNIRPV